MTNTTPIAADAMPAGEYAIVEILGHRTMTDRFIRMKELVKITGLSERTIYNRESAGTFPARVHIGPNAVAWRESDLVAWMQDPAKWVRAA